MPARSRAGRPSVIQLGATAATLKTYVLADTTIGSYQRRPLSEYAAPVRIGPPDYDARQVASTVAFPDFAGGLGKYLPDTRQDANRAWYSTADTRWPGIISLMPKWTGASLPNQPTAATTAASFCWSNVANTNRLYLAVGDRLYSTTAAAWNNTLQLSAGADKTYHLRRLLLNPAGTLTERLYWCRSDGGFYCSGDPTVAGNWTARGGTQSDVYQHPTSVLVWVYMDQANGAIKTDDLTTQTQVGSVRNAGHFLGVMQGKLFMSDGAGTLWYFDPTLASGVQVQQQVDALPNICSGVPWQNAQVAITDGRRVQLFHPTRPARDITPGSPDGLAADQALTIRGLFTVGDRLLAYVQLSASTNVQMMEYKGGGWHFLSIPISGSWPGPTSGVDLPIMGDDGFGFDPLNNRHWLAVNAGGTYTTSYNTLPAGGDVPFVQELLTAGDGFEASGIVETGWHYLGLKGLSGPLLQVRLLGEMPNTNVSVVVKYKVNFDETSWTTLGTLTSTTRTLTFASGAGVSFRVVRFQLTLATTGGGGGGTSLTSPNASFSIDFLKVPDQLSGHIFTIDIDATRRASRRTADAIYNDLVALAEQKTLPVLVFEDETATFVKLEAPRETAYIGPDGKKHGGYTIVGNEPVSV